MPTETLIYHYVFDTMSDWETGFATAELNTCRFFKDKSLKCRVKYFGLSKAAITTMGGMRIMPELEIAEISPGNAAMLILPGGESWLEPVHAPVIKLAASFLAQGKFVAAICGATAALAREGLLDKVPHTSNGLAFLKSVCPDYKGEAFYRAEAAITGGKLITASGSGALAFAREIIASLDVMLPHALSAWCSLHATNQEKYFYELLQALPKC